MNTPSTSTNKNTARKQALAPQSRESSECLVLALDTLSLHQGLCFSSDNRPTRPHDLLPGVRPSLGCANLRQHGRGPECRFSSWCEPHFLPWWQKSGVNSKNLILEFFLGKKKKKERKSSSRVLKWTKKSFETPVVIFTNSAEIVVIITPIIPVVININIVITITN